MFNPFVRFTPGLLTAMLQQQTFYLVSQTMKSAIPNAYDKKAMLLSDYKDKGLAQIHFNALIARRDNLKNNQEKDPLIALIELQNPKHLRRVNEILLPDSDYAIFANFINDNKTAVRDAAKFYTNKLEKHVRDVTTWKQIGKIKPELNVRFGELFFDVSYGSQHLQVFLHELDDKYPIG